MVAILKPYCLLHQKPKTSSRQQHEFAKREPQEPPYSTWAGEPGKISAPSSRRRVFSLDSPLYRTRLPDKWNCSENESHPCLQLSADAANKSLLFQFRCPLVQHRERRRVIGDQRIDHEPPVGRHIVLGADESRRDNPRLKQYAWSAH
jgi:hypothetical protein